MSYAFGSYIRANATNSYVFGDGLSATPLVNSIPNSLMVGFQSNVPTFYVGVAGGTVGSLGNVGIGTSAPANRCEINSAIVNTSGLTFTQLNSASPTLANPGLGVLALGTTGEVIYVPAPVGSAITGANNGTSLNLAGTTLQFGNDVGLTTAQLLNDREVPMNNQNIVFTDPAVPTGKNRIGIGTVTPISKLHMENNVNSSGTFLGSLFVNSGTSSSTTLCAAVIGVNTVVGSPLANVGGSFRSSNSINANIGVSGNANGSGSSLVNYGGSFIATGSADVNYGVFADASSASNFNYGVYGQALPATGSGGPNFAGYFNGDVVITGYFGPPSDINLKQNIDSINNALSIINQLIPKTFNFDTASYPQIGLSTQKQYGFIAQEVETILPELIGSATQPAVKDSLGNIIIPAFTFKTLNYQAFTAILMKGIQEQQENLTTKDSIINVLNSNDSIQDYRLTVLENAVNECCNNRAMQTTNGSSSIDVELKDGQSIVLEQNTPNPFAEQSTINYFLPDNVVKAQMLFYNVQGKLIQSVELTEKGKGSLNVFAQDLSNGIYTYTLVVDGKVFETKKMVKQK